MRTPSGASNIFMPATKSFRSGTWARTLFPSSKSACLPWARSSRAVLTPKNFTRVETPLSTATAATFAAGSIPSTGIFLARKC